MFGRTDANNAASGLPGIGTGIVDDFTLTSPTTVCGIALPVGTCLYAAPSCVPGPIDTANKPVLFQLQIFNVSTALSALGNYSFATPLVNTTSYPTYIQDSVPETTSMFQSTFSSGQVFGELFFDIGLTDFEAGTYALLVRVVEYPPSPVPVIWWLTPSQTAFTTSASLCSGSSAGFSNWVQIWGEPPDQPVTLCTQILDRNPYGTGTTALYESMTFTVYQPGYA